MFFGGGGWSIDISFDGMGGNVVDDGEGECLFRDGFRQSLYVWMIVAYTMD